MKKRVLSMLLAFILCFSTLPMTAFAQETVQEADAVTEQEEQQEAAPAAEPEEQQEADSAEEQKEAEAAAAPGEETSSDKSTTAGEAPDTVEPSVESVSDNDAGTQDTAADDEKKAAVQKVQALIDALPETVTVENAESVSAQLEAIDEAMESLTEEQIAELDMTRLHAISEAMNALMMVAEGEHTHCICGKEHHDIGDHKADSQVTFMKLWMDNGELKIDEDAVGKKTNIAGYSGECYVLPSGNYYLDSNLTLSCPIYIGQEVNQDTNAKVVNLCLNGKSITAAGDFDTIILYRGNSTMDMTLSLTDCQGTGKITHEATKTGCGVYVCGLHNAIFNMYGGSITGNKEHVTSSNTSTETPGGGGVYMNCPTNEEAYGGIFNMYGGTISNNSATNGGGLFMCNNVGNNFNMYDGSITGNTAISMGGGVYSAGGEITMTGGNIERNNASQGGGMYESGGSSVFFTMSGGSITGNTATGKGGGVYVSKGGNFKISGSVQITGNTKDSAANNVELAAGKTITIQSGLAEDASIGVTTEKKPGTGDYSKVASGAEGYSLTETDANHFFSDVDHAYTIMRADNKLILTNTGDSTLHSHPICGETCTHKNADGTFQHKDVYWEATSTLTSDMPAGYYYLTSDVTLTQSWNPADGMVLDLNGHDIIMDADGYVISKYTSGAFTLTDCMGGKDTYGKITHGSNHKGGGIELYTTAYASYTNSFVMYGGSITGNTGSYPGVYLGYSSYRSRTFTMYGGEITNNKNTSTSNSFKGGGVYVEDSKNIFTMTGGKITGNQTATYGGGVYVEGQSNFIVSGDAQITGNYKTDGTSTTADNVYLQSVVDGTQKQASIQVNGALSNNASISVNAGTIDAGSYKIVAQGSKYTLTDSDLQRFTSDAGYTPKLVNNRIAFTNGTLHEHKICGKTDCNEGHSNALWIPLTYVADTKTLKYGATEATQAQRTNPTEHYVYTLPAGNYYLAEDITLEGSISISGDVNICLDGHTISTNKYCYGVFHFADYKLTVCDCKNTGKISVIKAEEGRSEVVQISSSTASFELYGGTISGGWSGVKTSGPVRLYGGTIKGNIQGVYLYQTTLTIGGDAKVTGNTEENVLLQDAQTITINESLTEAAQIGITTSTAPTEDQSVLFATGAAKTDLDYSKIFIPDVKNKNYIVSKGENGKLYLGIHQHNWQATAEDAQITFKCNAPGCNLGSDFATTYTVTAPTDLTYSGSEKVATVTTDDKYSDGLGLPARPAITYQELKATGNVGIEGAPKDAGTYRATLEITNSDNTTATATLDYAITKAKLTVTANDNEITYGDSPNNKGVSYSGFVNNENAEVLGGTLDYIYSYKQYDNVGDAYTITPTGLTSDNYEINYDLGKLKVTPLEAKLEWENTANRTYGDGKGNVTAKITNLVNNDAIDVTVSGGNTLTAGTHTATATGLTGDKADNYKLPANATREYEIGFMAQKLTFATSGDVTKTYGDDAFANVATNDRADGSKVTYKSSDTSVAEVDADGNVTIKGAGTATITASAEAVEGKYSKGTAEYTLKVDKKTLTANDLEFTADSVFKKVYDGNTDCTKAKVQIKSGSKVNADDTVPEVTGTWAYNSPNVKDAIKVTFTSKETSSQNYILPAGLIVEHQASIIKADQAPITITSTSTTYGTDLTLIVAGGTGNGALTYTVENGTGAATINGSTLHPVKAGQVTVTVKKSGGDNYNDVTSLAKVITINKAIYSSPVSKTVNIIKNRVGQQTGTLTAADFFPEGQVPASAQIIVTATPPSGIVTVTTYLDTYKGYILTYIAQDNITSETDQTCTVTISSANYEDIEATLIFHPTDKTTVTIEGLTYTDKTYDGDAIQPTGTLLVTGGNVPANELEVLYEGTDGTTYNSTTTAPKDAGTYKVTYKVADSNENYTGEVTYSFTISPKAVTADMIGAIADETYTGNDITPQPVVTDGNTILTSGADFDFIYDKNINAGKNTATLTITGKGNYTGTASRTFTISPKDIKGAVITLQADSLGYTGLMQEVQITSVTLNQVPLTTNDYYIVNNSNKQINADASITLTIAGKGNYTGTAYTIWKITKASPVLGDFDVSPNLSTPLTYDGTPKTVTAQPKNGVIGMGAVTVCYEGSNGTTYARSETAPTNAGTYKVILSVAEGKNYTEAEIEAGTLTIEKADLTVEDVTEFFEYTKKGEQTINLAELVPGARSYTPDAFTNDNGIVSGDITIDATGLMKFALSELTKDNIDNKVTVPVTITSENYKDVRVNVIIYISPEYRIIDGANSSWTQNTDGTVVIRGNGEFSRFHAVKVDGKVIDPANYEAKEGSTIITLKAEYLKTLATGSHTFAIVWNNGIAGTNFTVAANTSGNNSGNNSNNNDSNHGSDNSGNNDSGNTAGAAANTAAASAQELDKVPATGDASGIWLTLFVISLTGLAGMLARRKKN